MTQINPQLLDMLLKSREYMTIEALCQTLSQRQTVVLTDLDALRAAGCEIESRPDVGLRLVHSGLGTWSDYLQWRVGAGEPRLIRVYAKVNSTQDVARRLIVDRGQVADRVLAVADEQTAGRGRFGRKWLAPPGSAVLFSWAWIGPPGQGESFDGYSVDRLILAVAVAIARAIELVATRDSLRVNIKWPNDIVVADRKLAGILVERFVPLRGNPMAVIVGVGINVDLRSHEIEWGPETCADEVTSLAELNCSVDRLLVLAHAIEELDEALQQDPKYLVEQWRARNVLSDRQIHLRSDGKLIRGHVIDIDPHEGLIVRNETGHLIRLAGSTTTIL